MLIQTLGDLPVERTVELSLTNFTGSKGCLIEFAVCRVNQECLDNPSPSFLIRLAQLDRFPRWHFLCTLLVIDAIRNHAQIDTQDQRLWLLNSHSARSSAGGQCSIQRAGLLQYLFAGKVFLF